MRFAKEGGTESGAWYGWMPAWMPGRAEGRDRGTCAAADGSGCRCAEMNLAEAPVRTALRVIGFGGCRHTRRLLDLGLTLGRTVEVLQHLGGRVVLGVGDQRLVLGHGMAVQVRVGLLPVAVGESGHD